MDGSKRLTMMQEEFGAGTEMNGNSTDVRDRQYTGS